MYLIDKTKALSSNCLRPYNCRLITTVQQHENLQLIIAMQINQLCSMLSPILFLLNCNLLHEWPIPRLKVESSKTKTKTLRFKTETCKNGSRDDDVSRPRVKSINNDTAIAIVLLTADQHTDWLAVDRWHIIITLIQLIRSADISVNRCSWLVCVATLLGHLVYRLITQSWSALEQLQCLRCSCVTVEAGEAETIAWGTQIIATTCITTAWRQLNVITLNQLLGSSSLPVNNSTQSDCTTW